ncbi:alpha/beta hydrolase fold domain-containing protein, partial [Collimonas silvisoli]|uniref:alpha/beta hydrolase fold domain-containing protein n=1 Tax=Collimonas silvisoli TaxID=2825884 RepID=UPI001B8ADC81
MPSIEKVRYTYGFADRLGAIGKRKVTVKKQNINGVHIEWIGDFDDAKNGVIIYLHGGAFAVRAPLADRRYCAKLSRGTSMPVVLAVYRLAPEHP